MGLEHGSVKVCRQLVWPSISQGTDSWLHALIAGAALLQFKNISSCSFFQNCQLIFRCSHVNLTRWFSALRSGNKNQTKGADAPRGPEICRMLWGKGQDLYGSFSFSWNASHVDSSWKMPNHTNTRSQKTACCTGQMWKNTQNAAVSELYFIRPWIALKAMTVLLWIVLYLALTWFSCLYCLECHNV